MKNKRARENALAFKQQASRLKMLIDIAQSLNSTLSFGEVLRRAMSAAERFIGAESSSIWQTDAEKGELFFRYIHIPGKKKSEIKQFRLKIGEGIAGWVAKHGRPLMVSDVKKDPRWCPAVDTKSAFKTRSILSVPIVMKKRVIGVIQLVNKKGKEKFSKQDLSDLTMLADLVAVAMENARLYEAQREGFLGTAMALATAIEKRDKYTGEHIRRVLEISLAIGEEMGLSEKELENLKLSAILHDIGKIGIPDNILNKPAPLTDEEFEKIKEHPKIGSDIMATTPFLKEILPGMRYHHERHDGSGYPFGLKGKNIPLQARIITVADTFDAITSSRPYRKGLSAKSAIKELRRCAGTQFDGQVVEILAKIYKARKILKIISK